tara:strand:- start:124 stop:525 length:402 start_codon:yes stop_codon:yes gene_type:complete
MNLQDLEILEDDFDLFVGLNPSDKIEFLFDAALFGIEASISKQVDKLTQQPIKTPIIQTSDVRVGDHRLEVTIIKNELHLNSNSLRCIRDFVSKMINDGALLWPIKTKKTVFDMYKYLRAYKVIARTGPISSN